MVETTVHANRSQPVIIVAGALLVDPDERDAYLEGCVSVVAAARRAQGCLDFALSPDLLESGRINVYERWSSDEDLHRFRESGPDDAQLAALLNIQVKEYAVVERKPRRSVTMKSDPTAEIDRRFSDPEAGPTPWPDAAHVLEHAELYWLTTVRTDGRPHVTPLIGVADDGAVHFCTGLREQKARNLEHSKQVALTTGNNTWARGVDIVVEGTAVRVVDRDALQRLADAYEAKYGSVWHFDVGDGVFGTGEDAAAVFRIEPAKVMAFAKEPHAQTSYRFDDR